MNYKNFVCWRKEGISNSQLKHALADKSTSNILGPTVLICNALCSCVTVVQCACWEVSIQSLHSVLPVLRSKNQTILSKEGCMHCPSCIKKDHQDIAVSWYNCTLYIGIIKAQAKHFIALKKNLRWKLIMNPIMINDNMSLLERHS